MQKWVCYYFALNEGQFLLGALWGTVSQNSSGKNEAAQKCVCPETTPHHSTETCPLRMLTSLYFMLLLPTEWSPDFSPTCTWNEVLASAMNCLWPMLWNLVGQGDALCGESLVSVLEKHDDIVAGSAFVSVSFMSWLQIIHNPLFPHL